MRFRFEIRGLVNGYSLNIAFEYTLKSDQCLVKLGIRHEIIIYINAIELLILVASVISAHLWIYLNQCIAIRLRAVILSTQLKFYLKLNFRIIKKLVME